MCPLIRRLCFLVIEAARSTSAALFLGNPDKTRICGLKANHRSWLMPSPWLWQNGIVLSCLFHVALWSPAGKGLTSWLCLVYFPNVSWFTSELMARLVPWNWCKSSSKIFYWPFQGGTSFVDSLYFLSLVFAMPLCGSVYMCLMVTCLVRVDLLAPVCGV